MRRRRLAAVAVMTGLVSLGVPALAGVAAADVGTVSGQPSDLTVTAGQTASFTSTATCGGCSEQWLLSTDGGTTFTPITGATSTTYSFTATAADDGEQFEAEFITPPAAASPDPVIDATSDPATLTVLSSPVITRQPRPRFTCGGCIAAFTADATGSPTPTVDWQYSPDEGADWYDVAHGVRGVESTPDGILFRAALSEDGWLFRATFSNDAGTATTRAVALHVMELIAPMPVVIHRPPAPIVSVQPALPVTGTPVGAELVVAVGLLISGAGLQVGARRRVRP